MHRVKENKISIKNSDSWNLVHVRTRSVLASGIKEHCKSIRDNLASIYYMSYEMVDLNKGK